MPTYYDISYTTTTLYDVLAGHGIMCDDTSIYCDSINYYCDGSVAMHDIVCPGIEEAMFGGEGVTFGGEDVLFQEDDAVWDESSGGGRMYNKISYS